MNRRFITTICFLAFVVTVKALMHGDIKFHIELAMQMADAKGVAATMEDEPEIILEYKDSSQNITKAALEKLMVGFFAENQPQSFSITHQGLFQNGVRHMTGTYVSTKGIRFEVYF